MSEIFPLCAVYGRHGSHKTLSTAAVRRTVNFLKFSEARSKFLALFYSLVVGGKIDDEAGFK